MSTIVVYKLSVTLTAGWRTSNAMAKIHIENDAPKTIQIEREIKGDTTSPKLKMLIAEMEEMSKKLNLCDRGLNIDGIKLTDLRFADDMALITSSVRDTEIRLNDLNNESKRIGLTIHKGETKYTTNF